MYFQPQTPLDVIGTSINYAATRKLKNSETLDLVESVIYCATVDQQSQVLEVIFILISKSIPMFKYKRQWKSIVF